MDSSHHGASSDGHRDLRNASKRGFEMPDLAMESILYDQSSLLICVLLFLCLVLVLEIGYRFGRPAANWATKETKTQINAISASMLGMLALLLGFTFSQSLERYDARSEAVVDEVNAIGTAYLRLDLIPESTSVPARTAIREYVDLRVEAAGLAVTSPEELPVIDQTERIQTQIWRYATEAAAEAHDPVTASFIAAVNEMFDAYGRRYAELARHVPESVILLLILTIVLTGLVVGFASGAEAHRPSVSAYALSVLIVLLVFLVIDLDRPRRGWIEVPHDNLISLQESMQADNGSG